MKFLCISAAAEDQAPPEPNRSNRFRIWYNSIRKGLKRSKEPRVTISDPIPIATLSQSDIKISIGVPRVIEIKSSVDDDEPSKTNNNEDVSTETRKDVDEVDYASAAATESHTDDNDNEGTKLEKPNGIITAESVSTPDLNSEPASPETHEQIVRYAWFWGNITRKEAESLLRGKKDGSFLVRTSSDKRFLYSLSFRSNGKTMHTRIEHSKGHFFFYSNESSSHRSGDGSPTLGGLISVAMNQNNADSIFFYSRGLRSESSLHTVSLNQPISRHQYLLDYPYEHSDNKSLQYLCKFVIHHCPRAHAKLQQQLTSLPVDMKTFANNAFYFPRKMTAVN